MPRLECLNCHGPTKENARFCQTCGASLIALTCPTCGRLVKPDVRFCPTCGTELSTAVSLATDATKAIATIPQASLPPKAVPTPQTQEAPKSAQFGGQAQAAFQAQQQTKAGVAAGSAGCAEPAEVVLPGKWHAFKNAWYGFTLEKPADWRHGAITCIVLCLLVSACSPLGGINSRSATTPSTQLPGSPDTTVTKACPQELGQLPNCQTPQSMRVAYGVESLIQHGFTGKGQTVVLIESFGDPTIQQDIDAYDQQFNLPPITIQVVSPLHEKTYVQDHDKSAWAGETSLDVEIVHAIAPGAGIVVMTSPVDETEGTIGLPEFRQLIQYAIDHHLGNVISNSWGASEATLKDQAGQQELQQWSTLLQKATTQQGITFFASSGDSGATDVANISGTMLSTVPTTDFVVDEPWVTGVGGTTLLQSGGSRQETAWNKSGGGFSAFYPTPAYQQLLPASVQRQLNHRRGVPDVAADGDPATGWAIYTNGHWNQVGGTSASSPFWAALGAIANQLAGHPLGFINPGLYKIAMSSLYAQAFHDITAGDNSVDNGQVKVQGYSAVPGWDPITGLGSPNAEVLLPALVQALKQ